MQFRYQSRDLVVVCRLGEAPKQLSGLYFSREGAENTKCVPLALPVFSEGDPVRQALAEPVAHSRFASD